MALVNFSILLYSHGHHLIHGFLDVRLVAILLVEQAFCLKNLGLFITPCSSRLVVIDEYVDDGLGDGR